MKTTMVRVAVGVMLGLWLVGAIGCKSKPRMGTYNVTVSLGGSYASESVPLPTLEVDLVGVSATQSSSMSSYPMSKYFASGDPFRADRASKTFVFSANDRGAKTLSVGDSIWNTWVDETELYIMVNLLGFRDQAGGADPRRLILPLRTEHWSGTKTIEVEVKQSGLELRTPMQPLPE